jgi:acyl carrier protein
MMDDVTETIRRFVLETALPGESDASLADDTPLQTSGILDSLKTLELITLLEERFGVVLDVYDTGVDRFDTIRDIAATVSEKSRSRGKTIAG